MTEVKAIESEMVKEFVANSHGNLVRVKELLAEEPGLVNACWDWGGGDWETALGAAAHTGQTEAEALVVVDVRTSTKSTAKCTLSRPYRAGLELAMFRTFQDLLPGHPAGAGSPSLCNLAPLGLGKPNGSST